MKLAFEIVAIWTLLNFAVGIPVWMLVKTRDRREMVAQGLDYEGSYASEPNSGSADAAQSRPAQSNPGRPNHALPVIAAAGRLVPDAGSVVLGAVGRVSIDKRSVSEV
jgi:hypothetical protein